MTQTHVAVPSGLCTIPDSIAAVIPECAIIDYQPDTAPEAGDLCYVEVDGKQFYGIYQPCDAGAIFLTPWREEEDMLTFVYRILGVLRPVRSGQQEAWN